MSEQSMGIGNEKVERARELLTNPRLAWHSVNGFDFGAAIRILERGIKPYPQLGGKRAISLAASPTDPTLRGHPTFNFSVLKSISFPVPRQGVKVSLFDTHDEIQCKDAIAPNELYGLMIPESFELTPLPDLPVLKPPPLSRIGAYINRQIAVLDHLSPSSLDAQALEELEKRGISYISVYTNYGARKRVAEDLNRFVLTQYQRTIGELTGIDSPNLGQAVDYLGNRYGVQVFLMPADFEA